MITVADGRGINAYSFFPAERTRCCSTSHRFHVSSAPYERDGSHGCTIIDTVQQDGNAFIS